MYTLLYMMHLVQTKNDLNRKRRRFYSIKEGRKDYARLHKEDRRYKKETDGRAWSDWQHVHFTHMHPAYSKLEGKRGYEKAKRDMKGMTAHMREVRKALKARYIWDYRGAIHSVTYDGARYYEKDIARLARDYLVDKILINS